MNSKMNTDEIDSIKSKLEAIIEKVKLLFGRSLEDLVYLFNERNYDLRIGGECVRDFLIDKTPKRFDLVTSASIPEIKQLFNKNHVSIIDDRTNNAVTLTDAYKHTFKITTIRPNDVQSNSATKFKAYWKMNAYSRIFRIDSMFLDFDGRIYDYFNGLNDILRHQIRMNDDPDKLLQKDCMRILRYFKLFGLISNGKGVHDVETIKAITANMARLGNINGQLIWKEMKKILMQPQRGELLEKIVECGGAIFLGLPDTLNFDEFHKVTNASNFPKHPLLGISYLCALLKTREDVMKVHHRLRLSAYERDLAIFLVKYKEETRNIDDFVYYTEMCVQPFGANRHMSREYVLELLKYHNKETLFRNLLEQNPTDRTSHSNDSEQEKTDEDTDKLEEVQSLDDFKTNSNSLTEVPLVVQKESKANYAFLKKRKRVQ